MPNIYQLNEFQSKTLNAMANSTGSMTAVVLAPVVGDEFDIEQRLTEYKQMFYDLETLGLIVDATSVFKDRVDSLNIGRPYKIYIPSLAGFDMFNSPRGRLTQ